MPLNDKDRLLFEGELDDALHELTQPLTALLFLTDASMPQTNADTWKDALEAANTETRRAIVCLKRARGAAAKLNGTAEGEA